MDRHAGMATPAARGRIPDRSVLTRAIWMLALGILELLAVTVWLDSEAISASGTMRLILKKLPDGFLLIVIAFALTLLFGGVLGWKSIEREIERRRIVTRFPLAWYGVHLACLGLFAAISSAMTVQAAPSDLAASDSFVLPAAWFASAFAACATWLAGLLPVSLWTTAIGSSWRGMLAAVPITLAAWLVGREARGFWLQLSEPTLSGAVLLLRAWGEQPFHDAASSQLSLRDFTVVIDPHCSGYEGVGMMAVFSSVYVWALRNRLRFPQAVLLIPLAMLASWLGNIARIALLVEVGARVSPAVARGGFHSQAGWMFLIVVSALVLGAAQRLRFFNADAHQTVRLRESAVAACLAPFLLWNVIGIISVLCSADPQFDPLYPARFLAWILPLAYWRPVYARMLRVDSGLLIGCLTGCLAFAVWMALELALQPEVTPELAPQLGWSEPWPQIWLACRIVGSCLAIPFIEELAFRGYLLRRVQSFRFESIRFRDVSWPGYLVSTLAFGALHGERWLAGMAVGLMYALAVRRTERLSSAVFAHAVTNSLLTAYVLTTGDYARWH